MQTYLKNIPYKGDMSKGVAILLANTLKPTKKYTKKIPYSALHIILKDSVPRFLLQYSS
jgi:hypothetical protein